MGCPNSKLGSDDEALQICKDRKRFIKQALEHRTSFASSHIAYIHSLRNVSNALHEYIEGEESLDTTSSGGFIESELDATYLMASGSRPVLVQEKPLRSLETCESDSFFADNSLGTGCPNIQPPSPHNSQWDFFWNPFSPLDYYGYNYDKISGMDDEMRSVREQEGIPYLEEDCNGGKMNQEDEAENERDMNCTGTTVTTNGETHGYTLYLNRTPTSMREVIKDLEDQFTTICTSANEVSGLLEASRAHYTASNEQNAMKLLNPVALFSSRSSSSSSSSSSRFLISSESSSDFSEESCMLSGSHQATLDRLYAWEKKLYDEVKSGERVRIAYEKKCLALRNHDVKGYDSSSVGKTRAIVRDLHTQMKVSIYSIESISERIESLRDQELLPQILELLQGLARMWKVMAECHQIQKRTLDEAKLLLSTTMPCYHHHKKINTERLARSALNLVAQLLNWRACFQAWITSQRSYVLSLTGWLLRCLRCDPDPEKVTLSTCPHLIYEVCIGWSRLLNGLNEKHVVDNLDFFASGMGSLFALKLKDDSYLGTESIEADKVEKLAEIAVKVVCHGMSVAVSSLAEFAISSADEHLQLINHPEDATSKQHQEQTALQTEPEKVNLLD